jgi:glycerol-3-phosphate acyltransferase PlsY
MAGLLVWRHYENINRLLKGTESRLGKKKAQPKGHHKAH